MAAHVDFHFLVQAIVHDQAVSHSYTMWLHGMTSIVGVVSNIRVVKVGDFLWLRRAIQVRLVQGSVNTVAVHLCGIAVRRRPDVKARYQSYDQTDCISSATGVR